MSPEKTKLLNLMRFWLFGTFVIVWDQVTAYIGLFTDQNALVAIKAGFPIWGITGVLCIVWYLFYRWWMGRKADKPMAPPGPKTPEM